MANVSFQTSINRSKPWGVDGDFLDDNYNHMYPLTLLVKEGEKVRIGKFVWGNGDGTCSPTGTGQPTGVAHRTLYIPITDITTGATMDVPANFPVGIADKCSILMTVENTPVIGNKIFVNNTTGAITNAAAGETVEGATETSFKIVTLCDNEASDGGQQVGVTNWE